MTGAPKIRAMELIADFEQLKEVSTAVVSPTSALTVIWTVPSLLEQL